MVLFGVFVLEHVGGYGGDDLFSTLILTKIIHKIPIRSDQVHNDSVINL